MSLTVLEEYIETGNFQDLELALNRNPALVHQNTSHDISPLLLACYYHKPKIIQVILKYINSITIYEACAAGLKEHVQMMIDHKKDVVNELSTHSFTPLGIAAHFGQEDIVQLLLNNQAAPNIPSQNGFNVYPLHAALAANNTIIAKMLIDSGAEVNVIQQGKITPLHLASQFGNIEIIIRLLEEGARIDFTTHTGETASDLAANKGFQEIAEILRIK